jgi:hypothetical protein
MSDDDARSVTHAEIAWTVAPLPHVESMDLLEFDDDQLFNHARDLALELEALRALLHESLTAVARLTAQLTRATETVRRLQDTVQKLRGTA